MTKDNASTLESQKAAALAPATLKNFRNHSDIENFYRFIYESDLRKEALLILGNRYLLKNSQSKNKK